MAKKLTIFGAVAVLMYVIHVIVGGFLWEGYSHLHQPVSDLTARGAPDRALLSIFTFLYGVFSIIFSASAYLVIKSFAPKIARIGMLLFLFMHLISITYNLFPEDLPGAPMTFSGIMHLVITALIIPLTIVAPILVGIGMKQLTGFRLYGKYSIVTGVVFLIAGVGGAIFFAMQLPYFGLLERISIGALQLWMLVTSIKLFSLKETGS